MYRFTIAVAFFCCCFPAFAGDENNDLFSGTWVNDRGSEVTLTNTDGLLTGYYQTNVGQPDKSYMFALVGFVEGDQITFTVNFKGYGSMTSWTGQLSKDKSGEYIRTMWHLTREVADDEEKEDLWKSITTGASNFRRVRSEGKSLLND